MIFIVPALGVVGLIWFLNRHVAPSTGTDQVDSNVEVLKSGLELKAGHLYRIGSTDLFTGLMLERSANDLLRSRTAVSNGLLQGLSEGWHTNGQLQVTEYFKEGVSHGLRTKWYPSGAKLSEGEIVDGKFHGTFRRWTETGSLAEQVEFTDGQPDGLSLAYYPSGFLKARIFMDKGKVLEKNYWPDGEQKEEPIVASVTPSTLARSLKPTVR